MLGAGSRRHSSVPKPTGDDSVSQCGGSSPVQRSLRLGKFDRSPLYLMDSVSKTTLENVTIREEAEDRAANIKLALDDLFLETRAKFRKNPRVLSTIASSSTTSDYPSQTIIRESRSLDLFPVELVPKKLESCQLRWKEAKRSFRSLENCDKCTRKTESKTNITDKLLNNNYPNGNVIIVSRVDNSLNEAQTPLLEEENTCSGEAVTMKRWRSLDQVVTTPSTENNVPGKKSSARNSIRSWLVNLFNSNGLRNSDVSLRRGVIAGYDIPSERESIV